MNARVRPTHPRALIRLEHEVSLWFARSGLAIGALSLVVFGLLLFDQGVPRSIERRDWEVSAQLVILLVLVAGYLLAWRWEGAGGAVLVLGGVALGIFASIAFEPRTSLLAALAFATPGVLLIVHWQRHAGPVRLGAMAVVLAVLLVSGGVSATRVYDHFYGPTHPESTLPGFDTDIVDWMWAGAVDARGFTVKAGLADGGGQAPLELLVGQDPSLTGAARFPAERDYADDPSLLTFRVTGLQPSATYYYAVATGGRPDSARLGRITTFPAGPGSFTIALGSCMRTGSNGQVFDRIREANPLFFLIPGDFNYEDMVSTDPSKYADLYRENLGQPAEQALFLDAPLVYSWDDHDYGGNSSDRYSRSRDAVREAYAAYVPHYPLADVDGAIYQAFTVGRVRFIVTDSRSERDPEENPPTMLGEAQKAWLKDELLAANGRFPLIVWVNGVPWIADEKAGADHWGGFAEERGEIADFIAANGIKGLAMVSGDAHMLAVDDGTNSDYAATGGAGFPVFHAAALDRRGSTKGGPYSEGAFPGGGQFGLMTVTDNGGESVEVTWAGYDYTGREIIRFGFTSHARE